MLPSAFEPTTTQVDRVLNSSSRQQQMRMQHQNASSKLRTFGTISRNSTSAQSSSSSNSLKDSNAVHHRILSTGEYSDLRLLCHGREYHVHKCIVCPQVAFLEGACREGFREAATGVVDLSNLCESSDLLQKVINFLYVHDVPISSGNSPDHSDSSKTYVSLYILSDKLGIPSLREHCMSRVKAYASMLPHKTVYEMTEMVYSQTMPSDEFRSILVKQVCQRAQRLFESDDARGIEEFRNFCGTTEEIWFDVIKYSLTFGGGMNALNRGHSFQVVIP